MDYNEFKDALATLDWASYHLEEAYAENEGEVTEETEKLEAEVTALRQLLNTDGVDFLGRWLKGKEDKKKALKAEKDYVTRQIEAVDKTIDFIKSKIREVMDATGCEKVKGSLGYTFAVANSTKTEVDKSLLKYNYDVKVERAIRDAGVPEYIGFTLTASSTRAKEVGVQDGDDDLFVTTETPTIRFTKPRIKE